MSPTGNAIDQPDAAESAIFLMAGVFYVALFAWLAVTGWAAQRRREREAFYRGETERGLVEQGKLTPECLLAMRREEELARLRRRREALKLGGWICAALGAGLHLGLRFVEDKAVYQIGWVPLTLGMALLLYAHLLYPKAKMLPPLVREKSPGDS